MTTSSEPAADVEFGHHEEREKPGVYRCIFRARAYFYSGPVEKVMIPLISNECFDGEIQQSPFQSAPGLGSKERLSPWSRKKLLKSNGTFLSPA
jgi:hypothetical protein